MIPTEDDLFHFWSQLGPDSLIHPSDEEILKRMNSTFDLHCIPQPFMGPDGLKASFSEKRSEATGS